MYAYTVATYTHVYYDKIEVFIADKNGRFVTSNNWLLVCSLTDQQDEYVCVCVCVCVSVCVFHPITL